MEFYSITNLYVQINLMCNVNIFISNTQGWEFAHLLITHLLIRSFRSNQMNDCERFAQIAQDK